MKFLAIIPARGGSKGVPGKNKKLLNGKPLINYTLECAIDCKLIDTIFVSTDDEDIAQISRNLGIYIPELRPSYLATDDSSSIELVLYTLNYYITQNIYFDAVILLQPTTPFRQLKDLNTAIENFKEKNYDTLLSVLEIPDKYNPYWVYQENDLGFLNLVIPQEHILSRRQDLGKSYIRSGDIYITKTDVLMNKKSFYGEKIGYLKISNQFHVNIDTIDDWKIAEEYIKIVNNEM